MKRVLLALFLSGYVHLLWCAEELNPVPLDINIDYSRDPFYQEIWFWGAAGIFFLSMLVLLIRGGKERRKESPALSGIEQQPGNTGEQDQ